MTSLPSLVSRSRQPFLFLLLILFTLSMARSQTPPPPATVAPTQTPQAAVTSSPVRPLVANLTSALDVSRAKVGTTVHAYMIAPWSSMGCDLSVGALIQGHVSEVDRRSKTDQKSEIHLVFDGAECNKKKGTPMKLTMIALLGPFGQGRDVADTPVGTPIGGVRSVEVPTGVNRLAPAPGRSLPREWKPGMVIGLPGMNLTVKTGADGGSIVWADKVDARLEDKTTLIMVATP